MLLYNNNKLFDISQTIDKNHIRTIHCYELETRRVLEYDLVSNISLFFYVVVWGSLLDLSYVGHCVVCPSIYDFWIPYWYLQHFMNKKFEETNYRILLLFIIFLLVIAFFGLGISDCWLSLWYLKLFWENNGFI
jgi:hypothetical protein